MDWTTISYLIAIIGCLVGLAGWQRSKEGKSNSDAEWRGQINAKLDNIFCSVSGIKNDVERIEQRMNAQGERLAKVEASAAQAHKRIDTVENMKGVAGCG